MEMALFSLHCKFKNDLVFVKSARSAIINFRHPVSVYLLFQFIFAFHFFLKIMVKNATIKQIHVYTFFFKT